MQSTTKHLDEMRGPSAPALGDGFVVALFGRRPQRAIRPLPRSWIVQGIASAGEADVARPAGRLVVRHGRHRLAAGRAQGFGLRRAL